MALTRFCCCFNLRNGCIVYAWLQLMSLSLTIANLASSYVTSHDLADADAHLTSIGVMFTRNGINSLINIGITEQLIKGVTSVVLTWGLAKKNHLFYQPWLFVQAVENVLLTLFAIILFFVGFKLPALFIGFILAGIFAGIGWYLWTCVHTVYRRDKMTCGNNSDYDIHLDENI